MNIKQYTLLCIILLICDFIYLKSIKTYFNKQIFDVQRSNIQIDYMGLILCYILLSIGLYYFIIYKELNNYELFFLGIIIYGVFELTNKALLLNWKWETVIIDTLWGGILFILVKTIYDIIL